jgi:hypothetical protein
LVTGGAVLGSGAALGAGANKVLTPSLGWGCAVLVIVVPAGVCEGSAAEGRVLVACVSGVGVAAAAVGVGIPVLATCACGAGRVKTEEACR